MSREITAVDGHKRAVWNGITIAESDTTLLVEGNVYFPPAALDRSRLEESSNHTHCPWKGDASYYDIVVEGDRNAGSAWYYPAPYDAASAIKDHVAFWRGVEVVDS